MCFDTEQDAVAYFGYGLGRYRLTSPDDIAAVAALYDEFMRIDELIPEHLIDALARIEKLIGRKTAT